MFKDLYDSLSRLFSWRWHAAGGEITAIDTSGIDAHGSDELNIYLGVAYKFLVDNDGPYTGETYWSMLPKRAFALRDTLRIGQAVVVRYRADDPSVNKLDRRCRREL